MSKALSESLRFSPGLAAMLAQSLDMDRNAAIEAMQGDVRGTVADHVITDGIGAHDESVPEQRYAVLRSRNIPASAPAIRKERRALIKALGARQFKKIYRGIKV